MPIMKLSSKLKDPGVTSALLFVLCIRPFAEAAIIEAAGRSRSRGWACNFLRGCNASSNVSVTSNVTSGTNGASSNVSVTSNVTNGTNGTNGTNSSNGSSDMNVSSDLMSTKTFHAFNFSVNRREFNNITVLVKRNVNVIDESLDDEVYSDAGVTNAALWGNVTCEEGVICNDGVIDNRTNFTSKKSVPHVKLQNCSTSKWVQVDLRQAYWVSEVALFWPYKAGKRRKYCSLRLDVSQNGSRWETIYKNPGQFSRPTDGKGFWLTIPEEYAEARYVRWYSSRSDKSPWVEFVEMQVFGRRLGDGNFDNATMNYNASMNGSNATGNASWGVIPGEGLAVGEDPTPPWHASFGGGASRAPVDAPPEFPPSQWPLIN